MVRTSHRGEVERMALALHWFLRMLTNDVRVQNVYHRWLSTRLAGALDSADDLTIVEYIVSELGLDMPFLPPLLLRAFAARAVGEAVTGQPWLVGVEPGTKDLNGKDIEGRHAKNHGDNIPRDVQWFYRVKVRKGPGDSVRAIAREYAKATGRKTDARSVIQASVNRIEQLLAGFRE